MNLIEVYCHRGNGYNPFLIREGWQVAQLNYMPEQDLMNICKMDKHLRTDEVFILLKGTAVLIAAKEENTDLKFECVKMEPGITYNIPALQWHNIAMGRDAELIIVERDHTHRGDCEYKPLNMDQKNRLDVRISELIGSDNMY